MDTRTAILAFLAGRSPAAYIEADIARHVIQSGRIKGQVASIHKELEYLASNSAGLLVESKYDGVSADIVWYATTVGVSRWRAEGSPYIP